MYDVIVAGAGASGCAAALMAARMGKKVLLIDKNGYPGGSNTASMVCPMMAFHAGNTQIVKGIAQEIIDEMIKRKACLGHIVDPLGVASSITPIEPAELRLVYFSLFAKEKNVELLLNSFLCGVETSQGKVVSVSVVNKSGMSTIKGKRFIDATGDGDLAAFAKVPYEVGRKQDSLSQPMTLIFKIGGVDFDVVREYIRKNPEQFVIGSFEALDKYVAVSGYFDLVKEAKEKGELDLPRDRILLFEGIHPREAFVNTTRVLRKSGLSGKEITEAEEESSDQVDQLMRFFHKRLPGFENCWLIDLADQIGVRESRHIVCERKLTIEDIYKEKSSEEGIAVCAYPIDIHNPSGQDLVWIRSQKVFCYDIPYGVMVPRGMKNLLVTGRCMNADHESLASARISPTASALGQAAGCAAALSLEEKCSLKDVNIKKLRDVLRKSGAVVSRKDVIG